MDARAVEQAWERLKRAEEALHRIKLAEGYSPAEEAWTDFLMAAGTIYTKLEQGAKGHGKSAGWYGRKKKERKDDPLLRYLHYARNSEEHGIERVVVKETGVSFEGPLKFGEWRLTKVNYADATKKPQTVEKRDFIQTGPCLMLTRVHDTRFNDYCDPPTRHRGEEIAGAGRFPYHVALLGLAYLSELIREAEGLVEPPSKTIAK